MMAFISATYAVLQSSLPQLTELVLAYPVICHRAQVVDLPTLSNSAYICLVGSLYGSKDVNGSSVRNVFGKPCVESFAKATSSRKLQELSVDIPSLPHLEQEDAISDS
ncbi:hypothetical protein WJX77_000682 [Trebouxia sp. C0004]